MAVEHAPSPGTCDRDLASIHEARTLARRARQAQTELARLSQEGVDAIVDAMAAAVVPHAEALARLAVEETGYGVVADKTRKNLFAAERVHAFIRPMTTVGVLRRLEDRRVVEIAEPFGVVAAIVPSTNPTSTAIYKILIAIKARCAIVLSPHPAAVGCITRTAEIMADAARRAGAPDGSISWMTAVSLEGTTALMTHRDVAVILATGGLGLVRAAYSAGKPAYGVGPGNAPAYIETSADVRKAVADIIAGKTFDNGVLCSSENAVVVDDAVAAEARREFVAQGAYFLSPAEVDAVGRALVSPQMLPDPALVGKSASAVAVKAGLSVPPDTRVLMAPLAGVGRAYPLSVEKLCPVLAFYVVRDWREASERCAEILRFGGMGHTMAIHSANEDIILQFGLTEPAFRIVVNSPSSHGSIGLTTGLDPALTLGCGGYGGNITADNITPRHLINVKRLAYEVVPALAAGSARPLGTPAPVPALQAPQASAGAGVRPLDRRIKEFLASRGIRPAAIGGQETVPSPVPVPAPAAAPEPEPPAEFVCEDDVRQAIRGGRMICVDERSIVTPAARDLGEEKKIFIRTRRPRGPA